MSGASKDTKLAALVQFASMAQHNQPFIFLLGFLAGMIDWVHFVPDVRQQDTSVFMSVRRLPHIHRSPFAARIGGVEINDPVQVVSSMAGRLQDVYVQLDFDGVEETAWYRELAGTDDDPETTVETSLREQIAGLRDRIDQILDIYGECMKALDQDDGDREELIGFFLTRAENEMQGLSQEINRLQAMLAQAE